MPLAGGLPQNTAIEHAPHASAYTTASQPSLCSPSACTPSKLAPGPSTPSFVPYQTTVWSPRVLRLPPLPDLLPVRLPPCPPAPALRAMATYTQPSPTQQPRHCSSPHTPSPHTWRGQGQGQGQGGGQVHRAAAPLPAQLLLRLLLLRPRRLASTRPPLTMP